MICKAPLEYLDEEFMMECAVCHKKEPGRTRCINGHYVCNQCHIKGVDTIIGLCMRQRSTDPIEIIRAMMDEPFCHMHGPEHHIMVGAALLTAYKNAGGEIDLEAALLEIQRRGSSVPGSVCGFWGAFGAGISTGMFVSIITKASPLTKESWGLSNLMSAKALEAIGTIGGPGCCKRDSCLAILAAVDFTEKKFGVRMTRKSPECTHSKFNNHCIGRRCPFIRKAGES